MDKASRIIRDVTRAREGVLIDFAVKSKAEPLSGLYPHKLGIAADLTRRISQHQISNYKQIICVAYFQIAESLAGFYEAELKRIWDDKLIRGEWFLLEPQDILNFISPDWRFAQIVSKQKNSTLTELLSKIDQKI